MEISEETRQRLLADLDDVELEQEVARRRADRTNRRTTVRSSSNVDANKELVMYRTCRHLHLETPGGSTLFYIEDIEQAIEQMQDHLRKMKRSR